MKILLPILVIVSFFPLSTFSQTDNFRNAGNDTLKKVQLQEVEVTLKKKAVERLADRVIYDFSQQSILNSGSMLEGLKKIPGLIASESVDLMYQGKTLDVYMDGRPLRISGNSLISFLEGLPANSVDRIEIITNPGAEYAATSGNAIINIISATKASDYTSITYSGNYSFSNYDKFRNKTNNGILLASKFGAVNWKVNVGQSYKQSMLDNEIVDVANLRYDKALKYNYIRPSLTFNIGKSKLGLDYDFSHNTSNNDIFDNSTNDRTESKLSRSDIAATYQKIYENQQKKFNAKIIYSALNNKFWQKAIHMENVSKEDVYSFSVDYGTPFKFLDGAKATIGGRYDREDMSVDNNNIQSLEFLRNTLSGYAEVQTKLRKTDFILGLRGENYDHKGEFENDKIIYNEFKVFPNAAVQYNIMNSIFLTANYSRKIKLPSINSLNPNNVIYRNPNLTYNGNPYLRPTFFDNIGIKFSAFDYATLSYDVSFAKDDIMFLVENTDGNVSYLYQNVPDLRVNTFSVGLPLPLLLFTKGFDELMKFNFDINKIDILYFYLDYQKYNSAMIGDQKGIWSFFVSGQFILPSDINTQLIYKITTPGNYRYYMIDKPFQHTFDFNISKKFLKDNLTLSLFANDIFNTNRTIARTLPLANGVSTMQKLDTRSFGISLTFKIKNAVKGGKSPSNVLDEKDTGGNDIITP
ncbi:outer membrane beta-barrel family protein [Olivibacter sp. XZL3]|uniref:outer membrane beta-barrel family protein n=1 Tax=Olivibacter sp. XZL3 TaxID=1735116 RepID=UPI0010655421|nr:outer membrane beta-barrel family protein [Olivibacter sp. XZL3]